MGDSPSRPYQVVGIYRNSTDFDTVPRRRSAGNRPLAGAGALAKIMLMIRLLPAIIGLLFALALSTAAQGGAGYLLAQANQLRASRGLPAYTLDSALSAAAGNQAHWMAATGIIEHRQSDGGGPRERALNAGFPSAWVSENIYLGSDPGPEDAWIYWLNSPVHYAGLVSPHYDKVGIGSAKGSALTAFVMVFGNSTGRLPGAANGSAGAPAADGPPAYVRGLDESGNIKHEVLPGHTIGDIALFYGYTWQDIPAMLELNGMTADDIRALQPGSVFLVPPKAGTFTPTSAAATPVLSATPSPTAPPTNTATAPTMTPAATQAATPRLRIGAIATQPGSAAASASRTSPGADPPVGELALLGAAILLQLGLLAGAAIAFIRRLP